MTTHTLTELCAILEANGEDATEWIDGVFDSTLLSLTQEERVHIRRYVATLTKRKGVGESNGKRAIMELGLWLREWSMKHIMYQKEGE